MSRRLWAAAAVPVVVIGCGSWAAYLSAHGSRLLLEAPPFFGHYRPRVGIGTPLALATALLVVFCGPGVARRVGARWLPWVTMAAAAAWTVTLALVDGTEGIRRPLTTRDEYLTDLPRVQDLTGFLRHFVESINTFGGPDPWTTHVAGHPPGLLLLLAGLREIGLGGAWPAAIFCIIAGTSAAAAAVITVRRLVDDETARRAAPFLALLPAAVWVAVSGDAVFLGVSAWGIALLSGRTLRGAAAGGALLGFGLFLTYGLLPFGAIALAVLLIRRQLLAAVVAAAGVAFVAVGFLALGFNWFDGLSETLVRYRAGAGGYRPYSYYVFGNLAVFAAAVGPATVAAVSTLKRSDRLLWLVGGALFAVLLADVSGSSKAEVERIWLLFTPWVAVATARLDRPRVWLGAQAASGLVIQTVLVSPW